MPNKTSSALPEKKKKKGRYISWRNIYADSTEVRAKNLLDYGNLPRRIPVYSTNLPCGYLDTRMSQGENYLLFTNIKCHRIRLIHS
uniref:Uncharacterized protein n=1 Tax=Rhizophora mucronata TaxID=61149 RepID=A0A2P2P1S6_RHIMU